MSAVSRRGFIALLAGGAAAIGLTWLHGHRRRDVASRLNGVLRPDASTLMIGQHYLRRVPDEADPTRLRELLTSRLGQDAWIQADVRILIREGVRRDFAEDRVVRLGQWWLSETEARLCALTLLTHRDEPS